MLNRNKANVAAAQTRQIHPAIAAACVLIVAMAAMPSSQEPKPGDEGASKGATHQGGRTPVAGLADGRQLFETRCAGCHGLDGRGGERAPDIATRTTVQQRSDEELAHIIQTGIPNRGMPAFAVIDAVTMKSLVAYLRFLQGKTGDVKSPGDPQSGKSVFFGAGHCVECHMVTGKGGFIASDLSSYGRVRAPEEIREAITKPPAPARQGALVEVTTIDGVKYSGITRNEDNFSLQVQSLDGALHLLQKSELKSLQRQTKSLMPADYGAKFSAKELDDLVSFLMMVAREGKAQTTNKQFIEDEENE